MNASIWFNSCTVWNVYRSCTATNQYVLYRLRLGHVQIVFRSCTDIMSVWCEGMKCMMLSEALNADTALQ